jgi:hypothetical protein
VRGIADIESGLKPNPELMQAMSDYDATMREAGILQLVDGLYKSSHDSTRIVFHDSGSPTLQSGPFPAKEFVSVFWIVQVEDLDEAVAWTVKYPFKEGNVTEVRRIAEAKDFDDESGVAEEEKWIDGAD